jgi:hypothetical protein
MKRIEGMGLAMCKRAGDKYPALHSTGEVESSDQNGDSRSLALRFLLHETERRR